MTRQCRGLLNAAILLLMPALLWAQDPDVCAGTAAPLLRIDAGHPWRPPFGTDRVGALPVITVELPAKTALTGEYFLATYRNGQEVERRSLAFKPGPAYGSPPERRSLLFSAVPLTSIPAEVAVLVRCAPDPRLKQLLRQPMRWPTFEAEARARPDRQINPVDLGTILVPHDWLLLASGQSAVVEVAAIVRGTPPRNARVRAWFEGSKAVETAMTLDADQRSVRQLRVPLDAQGDATTLHVQIVSDEGELWRKKIRTMVAKPAEHPAFGAVETKLRYDAPIATGHAKAGSVPRPLDYQSAWDPKLNDVVVALPNGQRFVFWRGASYIPFWAGLYNTGLTYQWAEGLYLSTPNVEGVGEMPEALNDKELRYSSVRLLESTASRIHVRWTYQATDIDYRTWGDQPVEDYYFYPDGIGTRVVTLTAAPEARYELSEFITLTPQGAFPWDVLPEKIVEMLYLDGGRESLTLPFGRDADHARAVSMLENLRSTPAVYRVYQDRRDPVPAIYFSPTNPPPAIAFSPFYDRGEMVTPAYWGDHWPLSRGKLTRYYIHDGIFSGPSHSTFIGWSRPDGTEWLEGNPEPISVSRVMTIDALGKARVMHQRRWAWLIGKSDASEEELRAWAESFATPPAVEVKGARLDAPAYVQERRAIRLVAEASSIEIRLKPAKHTVNPVFELDGAHERLSSVSVDGNALPADAYAWDGSTLWLKARIDQRGALIRLVFR